MLKFIETTLNTISSNIELFFPAKKTSWLIKNHEASVKLDGFYHIGGNLYYANNQSNEVIFLNEGDMCLPHPDQKSANQVKAWFYLADKLSA